MTEGGAPRAGRVPVLCRHRRLHGHQHPAGPKV